jgi:hypothetical protein
MELKKGHEVDGAKRRGERGRRFDGRTNMLRTTLKITGSPLLFPLAFVFPTLSLT